MELCYTTFFCGLVDSLEYTVPSWGLVLKSVLSSLYMNWRQVTMSGLAFWFHAHTSPPLMALFPLCISVSVSVSHPFPLYSLFQTNSCVYCVILKMFVCMSRSSWSRPCCIKSLSAHLVTFLCSTLTARSLTPSGGKWVNNHILFMLPYLFPPELTFLLTSTPEDYDGMFLVWFLNPSRHFLLREKL